MSSSTGGIPGPAATRCRGAADGPDAGTPVDTGFIVYTPKNDPTFIRLLERLGIPGQDSDMSFSYHRARDGFHYAGTGLDGLFSRRRSLLSPAFLRMLGDLARFNGRARADLRAGRLGGVSMGDYVRELRLSDGLRDWYLAPMASAIWSTPPAEVLAFPAAAFLRFFDNHGLLRWPARRAGAR
jgi:predicted NAD/FAD-binding protein